MPVFKTDSIHILKYNPEELSQDANEIIQEYFCKTPELIEYAKETVHYDGYGEFGPESKIMYLCMIDLYDCVLNHETERYEMKYHYRTFYKEWLIDVEPEPMYVRIETKIHTDIIDSNLFDLP
jgi:hypothetical protein